MSRRLVAMPRFPNGNGRSRFSFGAVELCGLWLKYNSNPIDYS
jgi:hypothetical protein